MAEAAAVIGLVSSIASLVELCATVVSRIDEYSSKAAEIPETFRSLVDRLPLLAQTVKRIQSRAQAGHITIDGAKEVNTLVVSILEQVKLVEECLKGIIPTSSASRFDRVLFGVKSLAKDDKIKQAVEKIHRGIDVLVLHQTTSTVEVSDQILQQLSRLNLQNAPAQQPPNPPVQRSFGLCLGRAPLIDPDAFVGRQAEIQQLHQWLSPALNLQTQRVVSIVGMGGLGKTQLSLAYAREHGQLYSSVFWLNAKDATSLRQGMSALTAVIFFDSPVVATNAAEENMQVEKVRRWLSEASNDQWLIIFDNYDDPSLPNITSPTGFDIRQFFPTRTHGSILITTRSSKLAFSKPLKLQKLQDLDMCIAVLSQRSGRVMTEDYDCRRLAVRLDGLPLALAVAGTYLAQIDVSCTEYLDSYETAWNDLHGPDAEELMEYEDRTLSSTWIISLEQVRRQDAEAAELLQFWGYLNNEDVWYELITAGVDSGPSWMGRLTASKIRFGRAMSKLGDYSLVEARGGSYRIHPCLHDWISGYLITPLSETLFVTAVICLQRNVADELHPSLWTMNRRLVNHMNRTQHQKFGTLWDSDASDKVMIDAGIAFGRVYQDLGDFDSAEKMYQQTLARSDKALGPEHTTTIDVIKSLYGFYWGHGKLKEAEQIQPRAMAAFRQLLGPEHTDLLELVDRFQTLGPLYRAEDKPDETVELYQRAIAGFEKLFGPEHMFTLNMVNNLGIVYWHQGKPMEAEQMYRQALTGFEKVLGPEHPSTLNSVSNLGLVYMRQSKLVEADKMYQRALTGFEKALGPEHPSTLNAVNSIGVLYQKQGKLAEAEQLYQRALAGCEKSLGRDNPTTQTITRNLHDLHSSQAWLEMTKPAS